MPNKDFDQNVAYITLVYGSRRGVSEVTNGGNDVVVTWDNNIVNWYTYTKSHQCNETDETYYYVCIG